MGGAHRDRETDWRRAGLGYALATYFWWGFAVLYYKVVTFVPVLELLAHRIVWSGLTLVVFAYAHGRGRALWASLSNARTYRVLAALTIVMGGRWLVFLWAMDHDQVLQVSLGYFLSPLVSVVLGLVVHGERLRAGQTVAALMALIAVLYLGLSGGQLPSVGLALAALLGLYGSLRKSIKYDPLIAVTGEVLILQPFALAYIAYLGFSNGAACSTMSLGVGVLVMLIGPITVIPMIWFALAAHRLTLATLGFLSYITPSLLFIIAVAVFRERIDHDLLIGFIMVWMALIVYSVDTSRTLRDRRPAACRGVAT